MANFRNIHMAFWTDTKVEDDFSPEDKYIYLWCLTNPHTNICGCYEVSIKQIAHETGYDRDAVEKVLRRLDEQHNVIRYSAMTKELLVLNWHRYNWSGSEKLDKPLMAAIQAVKNDRFREYLADLYNNRETVETPYRDEEQPQGGSAEREGVTPPPSDRGAQRPQAPPERKVRHKYGEYGWVRLTDDEYDRLAADLGQDELERCIAYIDESAQSNGNKNKWKDWNLVIRKCSRDGWGRGHRATPRRSAGTEAMDALADLHRQFDEDGL
ncbi:MAG: hypothetical protein NC131_08305 [Roseburia sp.]|nr:hypothetical protein [Roseburia sp.]